MRISDWSSEVCSSDLCQLLKERICNQQPFNMHGPERQLTITTALAINISACTSQIGRASCRERGCQCVDLGGRRIIKKKKKKVIRSMTRVEQKKKDVYL